MMNSFCGHFGPIYSMLRIWAMLFFIFYYLWGISAVHVLSILKKRSIFHYNGFLVERLCFCRILSHKEQYTLNMNFAWNLTAEVFVLLKSVLSSDLNTDFIFVNFCSFSEEKIEFTWFDWIIVNVLKDTMCAWSKNLSSVKDSRITSFDCMI